MSGGGNSGIIIDITGEADLSFHGIPLRAIKKASFVDKLAVAKNLLKMVVNGVTYDFQKTALNGAVIFGMNYGLWDFVAPDDRFDFADYGDFTVGQTLLDMERILAEAPVPAWDSFIRWLNANLQNLNLDLSKISSFYIRPIAKPEETGNILDGAVRGAEFSLGDLTDAVSFLQSLEEAFAPVIDQPLSPYVTGEGSFGFMILCCAINEETGEEKVAIPFSFRFRQ
jgi:hypothetical protein